MTKNEAKTAIIEAAKTDAAECDIWSPLERETSLDDQMLMDIHRGRYYWPEAIAALGEWEARELYRSTVREYLADEQRAWIMEADAADVALHLHGTQSEIAERFGVSQPTVHGWKAGKAGMGRKTREKVAKFILGG